MATNASAGDASKEPLESASLSAANRITLIGAGVNVASALSKGAAGTLINSPGLIADAAHSVTDLLSDVVTLWVVNHARTPVSRDTPWGLGKIESVGSSVCAGIIVTTGVGVGAHSAYDLWGKLWPASGAAAAAAPAAQPLTWAALGGEQAADLALSLGPLGELDPMLCGGALAAISGVLAKEWLYRETLRIGNAARSSTMVANAWHHRTDALSSFVALGGLCGTALGFPALDSIAGLAVAAMVTRVGAEMGKEALQELVDSQVEAETLERVRALVCSSPDVVSTSHVRGRKLGPWLAFDLRVQVPFEVSVSAAKQIVTKAKLRVLRDMPEVLDVVMCIDAERPASTDFSRDVVVGSLVQPGRYQLMRAHTDYDRDVRASIVRHALAGPGGVWGVSHSNVHWNTRKGGALVEASLVCDPRMVVGDAHALARRVHDAVLATVPDVIEVRLLARRCSARGVSFPEAVPGCTRVWLPTDPHPIPPCDARPGAPSLPQVDLHLELLDRPRGRAVGSVGELPEDWRLPSEPEAEAWLRQSLAPLCDSPGCDRAPPARRADADGALRSRSATDR